MIIKHLDFLRLSFGGKIFLDISQMVRLYIRSKALLLVTLTLTIIEVISLKSLKLFNQK
jgi:hypothetical protein